MADGKLSPAEQLKLAVMQARAEMNIHQASTNASRTSSPPSTRTPRGRRARLISWLTAAPAATSPTPRRASCWTSRCRSLTPAVTRTPPRRASRSAASWRRRTGTSSSTSQKGTQIDWQTLPFPGPRPLPLPRPVPLPELPRPLPLPTKPGLEALPVPKGVIVG